MAEPCALDIIEGQWAMSAIEIAEAFETTRTTVHYQVVSGMAKVKMKAER